MPIAGRSDQMRSDERNEEEGMFAACHVSENKYATPAIDEQKNNGIH